MGNIIKNMTIAQIKEKAAPVLKKYGVESASVFGSAARGEDTPDSDVDILIAVGEKMGVYEFVGLQFELEETLGRKVDLVSKAAVNKHIKPYITKDLVSIYEGH